jgi:hypothetical protein
MESRLSMGIFQLTILISLHSNMLHTLFLHNHHMDGGLVLLYSCSVSVHWMATRPVGAGVSSPVCEIKTDRIGRGKTQGDKCAHNMIVFIL